MQFHGGGVPVGNGGGRGGFLSRSGNSSCPSAADYERTPFISFFIFSSADDENI
jgi:hypothetical protein